MANKKLTKEDLKEPDAFIAFSDRIIGWLERHHKSIVGIVVVAVVSGGSFVGYSYWKTTTERANQESLFIIEAAQRKVAEQLSKDEKPESSEAEDVLPAAYEPIVKQYLGFVESHKGSKASAMAIVNLVSLYHEFARDDEAEIKLDEIAKGYKSKDFFYGILQLQLAKVKMNMKKHDEAIASLQNIMGSGHLKFLHAEALLSIGLNYKNLGQTEKAIEYFEKVGKEFNDSSSAQSAKSYLRLMYLTGKKG